MQFKMNEDVPFSRGIMSSSVYAEDTHKSAHG